MLLALLSGQRGQTLHLIDIRNIYLQDHHVEIVLGDLLKSSRPGHHLGELNFSAYTLDQDLCIVQTIRHFLQKTCSLRGSVTRLFITSQKPHKAISRDTLSRWMSWTMPGLMFQCLDLIAQELRHQVQFMQCTYQYPLSYEQLDGQKTVFLGNITTNLLLWILLTAQNF